MSAASGKGSFPSTLIASDATSARGVTRSASRGGDRGLGGNTTFDGGATTRLRIDLAYDGAGFKGWAAQPGLRTVEGVLTQALETVIRAPLRLTVAGRTDSGVHAAAQTVHVDVPVDAWLSLPGRSHRHPEQALHSRLTGLLAREAELAANQELIAPLARGTSDLVVRGVRVVSPDFDARFSALSRRYRYRIDDGLRPPVAGEDTMSIGVSRGESASYTMRDSPSLVPTPYDPCRRGYVLWVRQALDLHAMQEASRYLLGEHDFLSYCKPREGATTIRTLRRMEWSRPDFGPDAGLLVLDVEADAFCHSMVRSLVGASIAVGQGRRAVTWLGELLDSPSRSHAAPVAPAHGLTLEEVRYPTAANYALQAQRAKVMRALPMDVCVECD